MAVVLCGSYAGAQSGLTEPPPPPVAASVSGVVETPGPAEPIPVSGLMVTLHRVGTDSSGPIDSVRTDAAGRYTIRYQRFGSDDAVYFAAVVYRGIAYFSEPVRTASASGESTAITVFDTTSRPVRILTQGHHIVVSSARPDGQRDVVEVWELSNDTSVTLVGRDSLSPVWTAFIHAKATQFTAGQGDVSATSLVQRANRILLLAPFGPGVKQISYSYSLPPSAFPLDVTIDGVTNVLEVLVEDQTATVSGATLKATDAANTQGRIFKRFLAQDVAVGQTVRIVEPATSAAARGKVLVWLSIALATAMAGALWFAITHRKRRSIPATAVLSASDALVAAIVQLDDRHQRAGSSADLTVYEAERAALKAQLAEALAPHGSR